jgi:cephalosporin hydroxylase
MADDRKEFLARAHQLSVGMGEDKVLFDRSIDLFAATDRHDYSYVWTWMGLPIIQLPADIMVTQEILWSTRPTVIVETGVARGGSVTMMASLLSLFGIDGKVIGVDIDIRPHNRDSIERHPNANRIVLIEGSSIADETVEAVKRQIGTDDRVMVILDSDHSFAHVSAELDRYAPLVTKDCFLVVADTVVGYLDDERAPRNRSQLLLKGDEPLAAVEDYMMGCDRFELDPAVNGKLVLTSSPNGYYRCVRD